MAGRTERPEPWGDDPESRMAVREEHFQTGTSWTHGDEVRVRKWVETDQFHEELSRDVGSIETEHAPAEPSDDGEIHELDDGTLSIPVFEEQIVVSRRTVVRERLLLRRRIVAETVEVNEEVHREQFDLRSEDDQPVEVHRLGRAAPFPGSSADPRRKTH